MLAPTQSIDLTETPLDRPRIGILWGDFPWTAAPKKHGKLLSMGAVARNLTRALGLVGQIIPYNPPAPKASPTEQREALASFLTRIDVLWADLYPFSAMALHVRQELKLDCPAILFAGGAMPKGAEAMLFPWQGLLDRRDSLLFSCQADQTIWRLLVRWSELHEWVVPLAVDETMFRPHNHAERLATRARYGLSPDTPLLLYVGRLNIQKNLHSLLHLLVRVRQEAPDTHLWLVGEDDDIKLGEFEVHNTGYVAWLRTQAEELGVAEHVTWVGPLFGENLAAMYAAADVLVNLGFYHRENFGLAQAEAQLCGTPVVCTAWGGFKDIVLHGETGYLVDAVLTKHGIRVDWATGADHVLHLLQDHTLRRKMSGQATVWAGERFSVASVALLLADVVMTAYQTLPPVGKPDHSIAYEPSPFAHRYEAHKRTCGWYAADTPVSQVTKGKRGPRWYPSMFQGPDYTLYETLIGPYASRRADELGLDRVQPTWVPYFPAPLALDPVRRLVQNQDPVWPHRSFLTTVEWEVARRVNGVATINQIVEAIASDGQPITLSDAMRILQQFHIEGLILFHI